MAKSLDKLDLFCRDVILSNPLLLVKHRLKSRWDAKNRQIPTEKFKLRYSCLPGWWPYPLTGDNWPSLGGCFLNSNLDIKLWDFVSNELCEKPSKVWPTKKDRPLRSIDGKRFLRSRVRCQHQRPTFSSGPFATKTVSRQYYSFSHDRYSFATRSWYCLLKCSLSSKK